MVHFANGEELFDVRIVKQKLDQKSKVLNISFCVHWICISGSFRARSRVRLILCGRPGVLIYQLFIWRTVRKLLGKVRVTNPLFE